jgi:hypothetical protein
MESSLRNLADDGVEDLHQLRSAVDQVGFARSVWSVMGWASGPVGKQIISFNVNFYKNTTTPQHKIMGTLIYII